MSDKPGIGLWSGVGLVVANMIGVGVLTSTGYMASDLGPGLILLAWAAGGLVAMAGARSYAALAAMIPRSGGEYRYLSDLVHPWVGYLAGWTSLLVGFSAPIALASATAGSFAETLWPGLDGKVFGVALVALITAFHMAERQSRRAQDWLAILKVVLLLGFVAVGLLLGSNHWPTWSPSRPSAGPPVGPFFVSLVYIAYAYSGWNAAIYVAEEFREPRRNVPRAMLIGTALVAVFYVVVNWVFVANLSSDRLASWVQGDTQRITLGHLLVEDLAGPWAARLMSLVVILVLASAVSTMVMVGPRVYSAMAREGVLPRALIGEEGKPPSLSISLQSALALLLLGTHSFELLMRNIGAVLTFTSALTVAALFRVRFGKTAFPRPGAVPLVAAAVFLAASAWMLWFAVSGSPITLGWVGAAALLSAIGYRATRGRRA